MATPPRLFPSPGWKRQNPPKAPGFDWEMYRYVPSLAGAIICVVVFLVMALLHLRQVLKDKKRKKIGAFVVIGAFCEVAGYGARIASHFNNESWGPYITQGVLTLIGPLWFAATVYMMLGRTIRLAGGEDISFIPARWYTRIFVTADVTTLIIQGLGASIMGTMQLALALAGEKIVIAGLALQVATFVVFLVASVDFQFRMRRKEDAAALAETWTPASLTPWRKMLNILYSVSALILFRCVFRLIEYAMGNAAYLIAHEWTLYCFDAVPMFLVLVILLVFEPTKYAEGGSGEVRMESDCEAGVDSGVESGAETKQ